MTAEEKERLAVLESRFEGFEQRFDEHRGEAKEERKEARQHRQKISGDVQEIKDVLTAVGGGWKTLAMVGAFSAFVGGLIAKFLPFLAR